VLPRALSRTNAVSTFAENRLAVTPRLSLVGGIRYDHYNTDRSDLVTLADSTRTFTPVTGRGGFVYDVRPDLALYGQYATANDSIGELISQSPAEQAWDLTRGRQVEFGAKQSVLQNRAEWTVAAYRLVKQKLLVPNPNDPRLSEQVGQQSSVGLEVSTAFALGYGVRIDANGTVLKAKFDDFAQVVSGAIVSRDGNRPTNVPLQAANLWLTWSPQPAWQVRTGLRYVGDRFIDAANLWRMPSYTVVDAGVRRSLGRRTAVDVRLFNMFDEVYARGFWNGNAAAQQWLLGAPRAAELSLTTSF